MGHLRLTIEPIPAASRLATLAKLMPRERWNRIRRDVFRRAGRRCQTCGREGQLHCHEVWQYNHQTGYQWLRGFRALCRECHAATHLTFVSNQRRRDELLRHFMAVNRLTRAEAEHHVRVADQRQQLFDQRRWVVNYGHYNLRMPALANVEQRRTYVRLNHPTSRYAG